MKQDPGDLNELTKLRENFAGGNGDGGTSRAECRRHKYTAMSVAAAALGAMPAQAHCSL